MLCRMSSAQTRLPFIIIGAVIISLALGSSAIQFQLTPTATDSAQVHVSETATRSATHMATATATALATPTATPTSTPIPTPSHTPTPLPTPDEQARAREVKVPILMYHHVGPLPAEPDQIRIGLTILPENFELQLQFLKDRGYTAIDFYQMQYALALGWPLPPKPVIFTFDDAYEDVFLYGYPLMQQYGFAGTVFVPTQFLDEGREEYMNWEQALELQHNGWRLEPHTKTHEQMDLRGRDFQIYQMLGSMETLAYHIGYQPRFFAYPAGKYNDSAIQVLKEIGYWGAVTTESSQFHRLANAYTWGRVRVSGFETLQDLANRLGEPYP